MSRLAYNQAKKLTECSYDGWMHAFKDVPQPFNPYIYTWNDFFIYSLTGPYLPAGVGGLPL